MTDYPLFTDRARRVMQMANREAQRLNSKAVDTEHVLLALLKEGNGVAAHALQWCGVRIPALYQHLPNERALIPLDLQLLPAPYIKQIIQYAYEECGKLNHNYVGTEHLLLGLLRMPECTAVELLKKIGVSPVAVREHVINLLGLEGPPIDSHPEEKTLQEVLWGQLAMLLERGEKVAARVYACGDGCNFVAFVSLTGDFLQHPAESMPRPYESEAYVTKLGEQWVSMRRQLHPGQTGSTELQIPRSHVAFAG